MKRAKNEARSRPATTAPTGRGGSAATTQSESITVPVLAPRNPYQLLARQRRAGAHDIDARKQRRLDKNELRRLREE
jgi:hypothetical protein